MGFSKSEWGVVNGRTLRNEQRLVIRRASTPYVLPIVVPTKRGMSPSIGGVRGRWDHIVMRHPGKKPVRSCSYENRSRNLQNEGLEGLVGALQCEYDAQR
jgi:hypothetical protein